MNEFKTAVLIKTTPKRLSLLWLLNSVKLSLPKNNYRLYIADEEPLDQWKIDLYNNLISDGHYVKVYSETVSVTASRNELIENLEEEQLILRVDDDFELGGEFKFDALVTLLEDPTIHFCTDIERQIGEGRTKSGEIRVSCGLIDLRKNKPPSIKILDDNEWKYKEKDGIRYAKAHYMRNLILIKRECFDSVKWNEELYFTGEHLDFFLQLKKNGFSGVFTPDSIHLHREDIKFKSVDIEQEKKWRAEDVRKNKERIFIKNWNGLPIYKGSFRLKFKNLKKMYFLDV